MCRDKVYLRGDVTAEFDFELDRGVDQISDFDKLPRCLSPVLTATVPGTILVVHLVDVVAFFNVLVFTVFGEDLVQLAFKT